MTWALLLLLAQACTTPDPFVAIGGGVCLNGGWTPRSVVAAPPPQPSLVELVVADFPRLINEPHESHPIILNTGVMPCIGHDFVVTNPYQQDIYVHKVRLWHGTNRNNLLDIGSSVWIENGGWRLVVDTSWDRYANPTLPHDHDFDLGNHVMTLAKGGRITFRVGCSLQVGNPEQHQKAVIYFVPVKP